MTNEYLDSCFDSSNLPSWILYYAICLGSPAKISALSLYLISKSRAPNLFAKVMVLVDGYELPMENMSLSLSYPPSCELNLY